MNIILIIVLLRMRIFLQNLDDIWKIFQNFKGKIFAILLTNI